MEVEGKANVSDDDELMENTNTLPSFNFNFNTKMLFNESFIRPVRKENNNLVQQIHHYQLYYSCPVFWHTIYTFSLS